MKRKNRIKLFAAMHKSVTDPEEIKKNKFKAEREKRKEEKKQDVGL